MTLKPPSQTEGTSQAGEDLKRQIASRVTDRWEKQYLKEKRAETIKKIKSLVAVLVLCAMGAVGFYAWKNGMLDEFLNFGKPERERQSAVSQTEQMVELDQTHEQCMAFAEKLKSAKIDYWKNAPEQDRPGKSKSPMEFRCLITDDNGAPIFLEIRTEPHKPMQVKKVCASGDTVRLPNKDFDGLAAKRPYFVVCGDRAYLSIPKSIQKVKSYPIPETDDGFNPSKVEFGDLCGLIEKMKIALPDFRYEVQFVVNGGGECIDVATVGYGEAVTVDMIAKKVAAHYGMSPENGSLKELLRKGNLRFNSVKRQN